MSDPVDTTAGGANLPTDWNQWEAEIDLMDEVLRAAKEEADLHRKIIPAKNQVEGAYLMALKLDAYVPEPSPEEKRDPYTSFKERRPPPPVDPSKLGAQEVEAPAQASSTQRQRKNPFVPQPKKTDPTAPGGQLDGTVHRPSGLGPDAGAGGPTDA